MSDPFGVKSAKKARAKQEEVTELQIKQQNLRAAKERRESVREARIVRANAQQAAASQGVSTSSAAQGGVGSITSQFTSNLSFLDNQNLITDQTTRAVGEQRKYEAKAKKSKAIWGLGVSLAGKALGI